MVSVLEHRFWDSHCACIPWVILRLQSWWVLVLDQESQISHCVQSALPQILWESLWLSQYWTYYFLPCADLGSDPHKCHLLLHHHILPLQANSASRSNSKRNQTLFLELAGLSDSPGHYLAVPHDQQSLLSDVTRTRIPLACYFSGLFALFTRGSELDYLWVESNCKIEDQIFDKIPKIAKHHNVRVWAIYWLGWELREEWVKLIIIFSYKASNPSIETASSLHSDSADTSLGSHSHLLSSRECSVYRCPALFLAYQPVLVAVDEASIYPLGSIAVLLLLLLSARTDCEIVSH